MAIKLTSTKDANSHGVKCLIFGNAGVGKTSLAATIPGDTVILSAEAGLLSLRQFDIPAITVKSLDDVREAYQFLSEGEGKKFKNVMLDSISEIAETVLAYEMEHNKDPRKAYGSMAETMIELVKAFRDLPGRNVVMTAKVERQKDEMSGAVLLTPSFPGAQLATKLPYLFDMLFYMRVDKDGNRSLQTQGDFQVIAKDRSGCLDAFEPPDLETIFAKISQ